MTFTITLFPFLQANDPWQTAYFRILNVTIGCIIAAIGSMVILPRSTTDMLLQRIQKQCQLAGESSEAVLHAAADVFSGDLTPQTAREEMLLDATFNNPLNLFSEHAANSSSRIANEHSNRFGLWESIKASAFRKSFHRVHKEILQETPHMTNKEIVLQKYESAIQDWKDTKGLFQLVRYDPFHYLVPASHEFREGCATILSRALRIQTTVVLLDGIIRNDPQHFLDEKLHDLLYEMGTLIRKMLSVPRREPLEGDLTAKSPRSHFSAKSVTTDYRSTSPIATTANDIAKERLMNRLYRFRCLVNQMAANMIQTESLMDSISAIRLDSTKVNGEAKRPSLVNPSPNRPKVVNAGSKHYALLFLQLAEHLTHRSVSLYDSWVEMEEVSTRAKQQ